MIPKLYTSTILPEPLDLFGQLLAQTPFAVWIAEKSGKVIMFNEAMRSLVGVMDPEKILDRYNIFEDPIATAQGLVPHIRKVLEGQVAQTVVMMDMSREPFENGVDPKVYYVRCVYFPLKDPSGSFEWVVMLVDNITQQYLEDLALSKTAHEMDVAHRELIERERRMVDMKKRIGVLRAQLSTLNSAKP